jgi:hypothetical protein
MLSYARKKFIWTRNHARNCKIEDFLWVVSPTKKKTRFCVYHFFLRCGFWKNQGERDRRTNGQTEGLCMLYCNAYLVSEQILSHDYFTLRRCTLLFLRLALN